jgi:hypothetical protein
LIEKTPKIKREKKIIANNLFTWFFYWKKKREREKALPIIYLHDFLIEKTQKKREKKHCQ